MSKKLNKLSVIIPALNEAGVIESTISQLNSTLKEHQVPHEIIAVDDGSTDETLQIIKQLGQTISEVRCIQNQGPSGFGRAIITGIDEVRGDAVVIFMADASDSPEDVVRYWTLLNEGWDCAFGSRFSAGGGVTDYPKFKLIMNRLVNGFIRILFRHGLNDTTNAFKAYRKEAIDGCRPYLSPHFNLTVELPLKCIIRGYTWTTMPITWRNRKAGKSKLKLKEMGSRYLFIILYCWLEKYFSRNDYHKSRTTSGQLLVDENKKSPSAN